MKNLERLKDLPQSDFLNFLYLEKERELQKRQLPGWSLWAIIGSMITLVVFDYNILKNAVDFDIYFSFYVFAIFFCPTLYAFFIFEKISSYRKGDSLHIIAIKDAAPYSLLAFHIVTTGTLTIISIFLKLEVALSIVLGISTLSALVALSTALYFKSDFVNSYGAFVVCPKKNVNDVIMLSLFAFMLTPMAFARRHLVFGFSSEFEFSIAVVLFLILLYILISREQRARMLNGYDEIINGYLYEDWSEEKVIKMIESLNLGLRPSQTLLRFSRDLINMDDKIKSIKERAIQIEKSVISEEICLDAFKSYLGELSLFNKELKSYLTLLKQFSEKFKALLKLEATATDSKAITLFIQATNKIPIIEDTINHCERAIDACEKKINNEQI